MRQEIRHRIENGCAFVSLYGNMSSQIIIDAITEIMSLPEFRPCMNVIYDARSASFGSFAIRDLIMIGIDPPPLFRTP